MTIDYCIVTSPYLQAAMFQGYEWVGWSNDSSPVRANGGLVELTFRFDAVRNLSLIHI